MGKKNEHGMTVVEKPKVINVEYQLVVAERDDLLEAEIGYKRRLENLEKEATDMLKSFDILYNENQILRSKLETPEGVGADNAESYNAVYKDRQHLREANKAYKRRIKQLEDDKEDQVKEYNELYSKHQLLTQKAQLDTEYATRARDEKIVDLEKEHDEITEKLKMFIKEREQYEYRIADMDKERNELQNKYDFLQGDKHELQLRCDVLQADREKLKEMVMDLEEQIPDVEQKTKEEQQFLSTQAQLVALQISNKDATVQIHNLKEEIRVLNKLKREKVDMIDRASSVIVDAESQAKERDAVTKQTEMLDELEQSKQRAIYLLKENDKLKSENVVYESKVANIELENKKLQDELNAKKNHIDDMSVLIKGGESLNDDYIALQDKLKDLSALRQVLENELLQEKRVSKLKIMELDNDLKKTKQALKEQEKLNSKCEHEVKTLQYENEMLQKVIDAQALELRNMKAQIEQIQNMLEDKTVKFELMQKTEKDSGEELRDARIQLHTAQRELANLKTEKRGNFNILKQEMETAKTAREEEREQLRKETINLKEEVKRLKDYEFKITTMDSEIRRLMNRLRMTEKMKKVPIVNKQTKKENNVNNPDREELKEFKRKQREMDKEKMALIQEKKQWEILKNKYADLQMSNHRLVEENKRVRGDLDGASYRVDSLERKFRNINVKTDDIKDTRKIQKATYVDKTAADSKHLVAKKKSPKPSFKKIQGISLDETEKELNALLKQTERRKSERKPTKTTKDTKMTSKKTVFPEIKTESGSVTFGQGYKEIHKNRYKHNATLALL